MPPPGPNLRPGRLPGFVAHPAFRYGLCILGAVLAGVLLFEIVGMPLFGRIGMPHEYCYLREPRLVWLHVVTDFLIGAAYLSISATLAYLVWRASRDIPFNWVFLAFGLFIVTCGFTHFMEVVVIWHPMYWLSGYVKAVTAAASVATAVVIVPLVPRVLRMIADAREGNRRRLEVEQLNQDLERFNYSVAHDLRAPLRGLAAFSQILIEDHGKELSPEARAHLDRMQASVARMDALITDLLKYATIGRQELRFEAVALDEVLRTVRSLMEVEIAERKAELVAPQPLPAVLGDALLLQVVFQNLLGNAIKFVPPGAVPRVEVTAERDDDHVTVFFTDNGTGIPEMARERIFRLFERLHSRHPGTGIGLAITQRAVERLNGRIGVESAEPGPGSRFWVVLRAAPPVAAAATQPPRAG
jgi:signal transduction histidine kinase